MNLQELTDITEKLKDSSWRIRNLYRIMTKEDGDQPFVPSVIQQRLYDNEHYRNIILKARQVGYTTALCIEHLDWAIFVPGTRVGIIAHTMDDAQEIFRSKVTYAWNALPEFIKAFAGGVEKHNETELIFANGSSIRVGTSLRSGTLDRLHVSEMGKIAARFPDKAMEIITGSLPTVPQNGRIFIESTAEGSRGIFKELCDQAESNNNIAKAEKRPLDALEWKFHFTAWHTNPEYEVDPSKVKINVDLQEYFAELKTDHGIETTPAQRAWYALMDRQMVKSPMVREYPSYVAEAFEHSDEGTYYGELMKIAERDGRITNVPYNVKYKVETWWDIGWQDKMVVIFVQRMPGGAINIIDYYENTRQTIDHFAQVLEKKGYRYSRHIVPWDGKEHTDPFGDGRTRTERAEQAGLKPWVSIGMKIGVLDQIDMARNIVSRCYFDATKTIRLIEALKKYHKAWDKSLKEGEGDWDGSKPVHDENSHAADAFRTGASAPREESEIQGWDQEVLENNSIWGNH